MCVEKNPRVRTTGGICVCDIYSCLQGLNLTRTKAVVRGWGGGGGGDVHPKGTCLSPCSGAASKLPKGVGQSHNGPHRVVAWSWR